MSKQKESPQLSEPVAAASAAAPTCEPLADRSISTADALALAPAFKALGDPIRLQLLSQIASASQGETCVCDLEIGFDVSGPTISHHLKVLREAGLIEGERRGTWIYYTAVREKMSALAGLLVVAEPATADA
ncbi:ArsR family transcriptional regulator [Catenulispora sp. MAP12-49]|uniref:ArsR/SmtB family transcription factor n=1 Tax=unclassified Catenulispora TaxID=414885 RepID=UPI003514CDF6